MFTLSYGVSFMTVRSAALFPLNMMKMLLEALNSVNRALSLINGLTHTCPSKLLFGVADLPENLRGLGSKKTQQFTRG